MALATLWVPMWRQLLHWRAARESFLAPPPCALGSGRSVVGFSMMSERLQRAGCRRRFSTGMLISSISTTVRPPQTRGGGTNGERKHVLRN